LGYAGLLWASCRLRRPRFDVSGSGVEARRRDGSTPEPLRMLERGPAIVMCWRDAPGWPVVYASQTVSQWGYQASAMQREGWGFQSVVHREDVERLRGSLASGVADGGGTALRQEYRILTASGETRWVDGSVWMREGVIDAVLLDITDRKQAERQLRLTQYTVDHAAEAILWLDERGCVLAANDAACLSLDYTRDELLLMSVPDIDAGHQAEDFEARLAQVSEATSATFESVLRRKDGRTFPVEITANHVTFDGQRLVCAFVRDVTERRASDAALAVRRRYEEAVARCSRLLLSDTENDDTLPEALEQLRETCDVSRVSIFRNVENPLQPDFGRCMDLAYEACGPGIESRLGDATLHHLPYAAGFERWAAQLEGGELVAGLVATFPESERAVLETYDTVSLLALPFFVDTRWHGFVSFEDTRAPRQWRPEDVRPLQTATEMIAVCIQRRRAARELQESNGMIIDALEREKRIAQQLAIERERAEEATRAKTEFLANMSHEIRTPMTAINGFAELLRESAVDCPRCGRDATCESCRHHRECVDTIIANGRHLLEIINDILDLSKIETGKLDVECIASSPMRLLAEVHTLMQMRAAEKGLELQVEFASAIPEVIHTDPTRLRQILINLIGNAIKFTERGSVRIVTRLLRNAPPEQVSARIAPADHPGTAAAAWAPGPYLQLDVVDTGIGMTDEQMTRVFRPFTQADCSTTRRFGGTGLGLAISKRLAESLGGGISLRSKHGEGSTFSVVVATGPLGDVKMIGPDAALRLPETTSAAPATPEPLPPLNLRILLAEDGPDNQRLITHILKKAGAEVDVADNGKIALERALAARDGGQPHDVVLMDIQMPVMDGLEATRLLREAGVDGPIIALTAHAMPADREKCLSAGCDDYATKPLDRRKLIEKIAKLAHAAGPVAEP
jgi:PAS domain S-box-containing protein